MTSIQLLVFIIVAAAIFIALLSINNPRIKRVFRGAAKPEEVSGDAGKAGRTARSENTTGSGEASASGGGPKLEARIVIFLLGLTIISLAVVYGTRSTDAWGFILALLPFLLILQHALFLRNVRRPVLAPRPPKPAGRQRSRDDRSTGDPLHPPGQDEPTPGFDLHRSGTARSATPVRGERGEEREEDWWRPVLEAARRSADRYFSPLSLALRYGTSAQLVLMVGLAAFLVLFAGKPMLPEDLIKTYVYPAKLGAAGAYVYALLYLGRRNFTHDVTSGGAMWCAVSLAVGPVLACALSHFFSGPTDSNVGTDAIYFMAGFSPRYVTSYVEGLVRKAWGSSAGTDASPPRTIPITRVKGINAEIADRLSEEGISDLHSLAMADPLRLIRNTNFDQRLIVSWIDEAILITTLPEYWESLEREGIYGAVDLVALVYPPPYKVDKEPPEERADREAYLAALCHHVHPKTNDHEAPPSEDDAKKVLRGIAGQLKDDEHLRRIWVLHNHIADDSLAAAS